MSKYTAISLIVDRDFDKWNVDHGRTTQTLEKAVIRKEHILSYHYYLNDKEFEAALKGKEEN